MVYPSHYKRGVKRAVVDGLRRSKALAPRRIAEIRPYLQAFTLGPPRYTPFLVREQIRALTDLGIQSWVLWNPRSAYEHGYFKTDTLPAGRPVGGSSLP